MKIRVFRVPERMNPGFTTKPSLPERIGIPSGDIILKGKLFQPADRERAKGIVLFLHGLGYCDRQYKIQGDYFARSGYFMLLYNQRGHAGTPGKWTLHNSVEDLIRVIDFLTRNYRFKNNERICLIGHSVGALIALLTSFRDPRIKFASLVTIATCMRDPYRYWFSSGFNRTAREFFKTQEGVPAIIERFLGDPDSFEQFRQGKIPKEALDVPHRYGMLRSESWYDFMREMDASPDILTQVDQIKIPLLLFRGEYDEVVDVWATNRLYEKLAHRVPVKLYITSSRNHFHHDSQELIQQETLKFFDEFCGPARGDTGADKVRKDILIVDDDALVAQTLKKMFVKQGFLNVQVCSSGTEALKQSSELLQKKNKAFDLVVMDIRMPGLDGFETACRLREIFRDSPAQPGPVVFMTGYANSGTEEALRNLGYVDYLYKPFDRDVFLSRIRKYLDL